MHAGGGARLSSLRTVREKKLREYINQVPNLCEEMVEKIVRDSLEEDDFIKAQQEFSSVYKREKFIRSWRRGCMGGACTDQCGAQGGPGYWEEEDQHCECIETC